MIARRLLCVAFSALLIALLAPLSPAWASYPGRAGEVVYQDSYSAWDPLNNGAITYEDHLGAAQPPGPGTRKLVDCQGSDAGFVGETQYCPESGVGFSPDGQKLVFSGVEYQADGSATPDQAPCGADYPYCPEAIMLAGADGSAPYLLPIPIADAEHPAFLPDGQTLVFAGRTGAHARAELYTVNTDGTDLQPLTTDGGTDPAPCPNGSIVYVHRGDLYLLSADRHHLRRLTHRGGTLPDCSHDSRAIVFLRRSTLYTINTTGKHLRRLSSAGVADGRPAYSPAGGEIAFTTTRKCTSSCGARIPQCSNLIDHLELINLKGRRERSYVIGQNYCSVDGDLGGDSVGDVDWQPLPAGS